MIVKPGTNLCGKEWYTEISIIQRDCFRLVLARHILKHLKTLSYQLYMANNNAQKLLI